MTNTSDLLTALTKAHELFYRIPEVEIIGLGPKIKNDKFLGQPAIIVGVVKKKPEDEILNIRNVIPKKIDNIQTDIIGSGFSRPCLRDTSGSYADYKGLVLHNSILQGGMSISGMIDKARGTLGCVAKTVSQKNLPPPIASLDLNLKNELNSSKVSKTLSVEFFKKGIFIKEGSIIYKQKEEISLEGETFKSIIKIGDLLIPEKKDKIDLYNYNPSYRIIKHKLEPGTVVGLTNQHVVLKTQSSGRPPKLRGNNVYNVGFAKNSTTKSIQYNTIGCVVNGKRNNYVDAAIIELKDPAKWQPNIIDSGKVKGTKKITLEDCYKKPYKVFKSGMTTGKTSGFIRCIHTFSKSYTKTNEIKILNTDKIIVTSLDSKLTFQTFGDSGSVLIDTDNKVVGLLESLIIAGHGRNSNSGDYCTEYGSVIPINYIESVLGINIATKI